MKNKRFKIGAIIIGTILVVAVLCGFILNNNENSVAVKPKSDKNSEVNIDKNIEENNSKKEDNQKSNEENKEEVTEENQEEDNKEIAEENSDEIKKSEESVSENKDTTKSNATSTNVNNQESNSSSNDNSLKSPTENKTESTGNNTQTPAEESKPEVTPEVNPEPVSKHVTISITCNTILNNLNRVSEGKKDIIPSNGVILGEKTVEINEGDTVFDVLLRETRNNKIHLDFVQSPAYGSVYIKGIANLYEFDAGDLSGWVYSVNGVYPNYGCSSYTLNDGDVIQWKYTCDLGRDV